MRVLVAAVLTMSAAQLLDLATFVTMIHRFGPRAEANHLIAYMYDMYGFPMVAIAKVVLLAGATAVIATLAPPHVRPRMAAAVVATGILVGLVGGLSNIIVIGAI